MNESLRDRRFFRQIGTLEQMRTEQRSSPAIPGPTEVDSVRRNRSGVLVTPDTAMRHSAWWACVNLIANICAALPWHAYRTVDGVKQQTDQDPPLLAAPSGRVTAAAWRRMVFVSALTRGNVYGWVTSADRRAHPTTIEILNPDDVTLYTDGVTHQFRVKGHPVDTIDNGGRLWHLPAWVTPGSVLGLSPVSYAAQALGLGIAAEDFGAQWFGSGGHPSGVLSTDETVTDQQAKQLKSRFEQAVKGGGVALLGNGTTYEQVQIAPNESQFLETVKANVGTIARFFHIPPSLVGGDAGGSLTYANVEQRNLELQMYCVGPWVAWLEDGLTALLPRPQYAKATTEAMLRLDAKTSAEVLEKELRNGVLSRNEWRRKKDLAPIEGAGDEYLWPPHRSFAVIGDEAAQGDTGEPT